MSRELDERQIERLAVKHEAFGFGRVDAKGLTTHGFDPDGLAAFAREIAEEAVRLEREAILAAIDDLDEPAWYGYENPNNFDDGKRAVAAAIRSRSQEGQG